MVNYEKIFDTKNTSMAYKSALNTKNSTDASLKYDLQNLNLDIEILTSVIQMYKQVTKFNIQRSKLRNRYCVLVFAYHTRSSDLFMIKNICCNNLGLTKELFSRRKKLNSQYTKLDNTMKVYPNILRC